MTCGRALVCARRSVEIQCVQSSHVFLTFNARRLRHQRRRMNSSSSVFMYASLPGYRTEQISSPDSRRACNSSFSRPSNRPPIAQHVSGAPIFRSAAKTFCGKNPVLRANHDSRFKNRTSDGQARRSTYDASSHCQGNQEIFPSCQSLCVIHSSIRKDNPCRPALLAGELGDDGICPMLYL